MHTTPVNPRATVGGSSSSSTANRLPSNLAPLHGNKTADQAALDTTKTADQAAAAATKKADAEKQLIMEKAQFMAKGQGQWPIIPETGLIVS